VEVETDGEPKAIGLADDAAHGAFGITFGKVVAAQVVVVDVIGEHVPHGGQHRVLQGDQGLRLTQAGREAVIAGTEVGAVFGAGGGHRGGA
jgi:hypothetical protein